MTRFEKFNEMLFESYCKKSVGNAIKKEREKKAARGKLELSFSVLTDAVLYALSTQNDGASQPEKPCQVFSVQGMNIPVYHEKLGQALSHLMPKDRENWNSLPKVDVTPAALSHTAISWTNGAG